jgi:hypothetical protein
MNIKKTLRIMGLIILIAMAAALPVPMTFKYKDKLPKYTVEQIDKKEEKEDFNIKKDAFS